MSATAHNQAWTDIAVFEELAAATGVETFLRGKGFKTRTHDDKWFRYFLFLRPPRVTYHVQVHHDDLKSADHVLLSSTPELLTPALHCPDCKSLRVAYPQMTRKFFLPTILLHAGILLRLVDHECYCEHCHSIWYLPGEDAHHAHEPAHTHPV